MNKIDNSLYKSIPHLKSDQLDMEILPKLQETLDFFMKAGIKTQLLRNKNQHNYENEPFQILHQNYNNVTGVRVMTGEIRKNINFYAFDIDCKEAPEEGREFLEIFIKRFPKLKNTYIEKTKSQGYHIFFYTSFGTDYSKSVWTRPNMIETDPTKKPIETELMLNLPLTVSPTVIDDYDSRKKERVVGNYEVISNKPITFISEEELRAIYRWLEDNHSYSKDLGGKSKNSSGTYEREKVPEEELQKLISILTMNGLQYSIKGENISVFGYDDGNNPDYRINYYNDDFYLWNVKDQHAKKSTLKEYVESWGREYLTPSSQSKKQVTPEETYHVEKYLSECQEVRRAIREDHNTLINSSCGTGKSYTTVMELKKIKEKFIFCVPNASVKEQLGQFEERGGYDLAYTGDSTGGLDTLISKGFTQIACCYESLKYVSPSKIKDFVLVIDEVHSIFMDLHYRNNLELLRRVHQFKRVLFLTATPVSGLNIFDKIIRVKSKHKINVTVSMITPTNVRISKGAYYNFLEIFREIAKKPTLHIFTSGIERMEEITGSRVLHSKLKNLRSDNRYRQIITGTLPEGYTVSTNLFNAGLSIKNEGSVNLIVDFTGYDVSEASYIQLINRFRQAERVNVLVIDRGGKTVPATVEEVRKWGKKLIKKMNNGKVTLEEITTLNGAFIHCILFSPENGFYLDEEMLPATLQLINGARGSSRDIMEKICNENEWGYNGELTLEEFHKKFPAKEGKETPKKQLKRIFITDGQVNEFALGYFKYRISCQKGSPFERHLKWQEEMSPEKAAAMRGAMQEDKVRNCIQRLLNKMQTNESLIEGTLKKYFNLSSPLDVVNIKNPEELKKMILDLEGDNTRLSRARKLLSENIEGFIPVYRITPNKKVKEILQYLGIKIRKTKDSSSYKFLDAS